MPETMSLERRRVLAAFGATLVLTPGAKACPGRSAAPNPPRQPSPIAIFCLSNSRTKRIRASTSKRPGPKFGTTPTAQSTCWYPAWAQRHHHGGLSLHQEDKGKAITSVAVEPTASPVLTQTRAGRPLQPGKHKIQGIGAGFVPDTLDLSIVDRVELATDEESIETARRLASEEGILSGISSGAATAVALRLAKLNEFAGKTIVVVLPDSGERYISTALFEGIG